MSESTVDNVRGRRGATEVSDDPPSGATAEPAFDGEAAFGGGEGAPTYSWRRPSIPLLIVLGAVAIYTWYFTKRTLDIHHALGTSSYDSALYDQGMWLLSRFEAPFSTLMGRNVFGDHTSFVLLFLVPFYWVFPGAGIMFFAQALAIGAGAIPVFLFGRRRLGSEWFAIVGAATYLLHPAVAWTNLENFHPDAFLGVFVGVAIYAALESKWRLYVVFVVLSLLVKEDASLVIVPLGIWVAIKRDRRIGVLTILGSVAFMIAAMYLVMRNLIGVPTRNGWRIPFGGPRGVIDTAVTNPTQLTEYLSSEERPWYIWQMTAPFAFLFLRLPSVAAISSLVLFTNVLSTFWYQHQIEYHYSLIAVPALSIGTVYAIGAVRERVEWSGRVVPLRAVAVLVLGVVTLITAYLWAPLPWSMQRPFEGDPSRPDAVAARELMAEIPDDAVVSANYRLTPHLAYREEIYQFPTPFRVVLYGPDTSIEGSRLEDRADRVEYVMIPTAQDTQLQIDWAAVAPAFDLVDSNEYWLLYQRDPGRPAPAAILIGSASHRFSTRRSRSAERPADLPPA